MSKQNFDEIAIDKFAYLVSNYGFRLSECNKEEWGYKIVFLNATTGVQIIYEFREAYIFVTLYKLVDGKLVENPRTIYDDTELHGFSLDDILSIRNPEAQMRPAYQYGADSEFYDENKGMSLYVSKFADNLKNYASDVLSGNFEIFKDLDAIVKKRAREARSM